MAINNPTINIAKEYYELLCDVKILLLESVQGLSKFAQAQHIFICDFNIGVIKVWESNM
jgi:hypothetical protein